MLLAIIFAQVWGVIQLIVLASLARTVRVRTVFAAMAVGFYLIGPVTALIQLSWIHLAAPLFGMQAADLQSVASYSVDPFIEEAMKLVPLIVLMLIPAIRRQWSITDCVLVGAGTGSGFGLTEHLFRYAANANLAEGVYGGWVLSIGRFNVLVPGFFRTMTSWIINGAYFASDPIFINWHIAWSAIGGLAVGLLFRKRDKASVATAIALLVFIGLNHAGGNAATGDIDRTWLAPLAGILHFLTLLLGVFVFATIVVAWWLDRPLIRAAMEGGPLLAAEQSATSPLVGTLTAAFSRMPWSILWVCGFDRRRRAFHAAHIAQAEGREGIFDALVAERDSIEQKLKQPGTPALIPEWVNKNNLQAQLKVQLKRPPVIIWLLVTAPPFLFLIIGGWPETAWLQRLLTGPVIWQLVLLITIGGQARLASRVLGSVRKLPATARLPIGDDAALLGLQLACGVGAVALGSFTLVRVLGGVASTHYLLSSHAADAASRVTPGSGTAVAGSAGGFDPPAGSTNSSGSSSGSAGSSSDGSSGDSQAGPPSIPVNDLPNAPPADPSGYSPLPPPVIPVKDLPDAPPADPNEYSPLPPPVIPVNDLPDAPPQAPEYSPLPPPVIPVNELPDAPPVSVNDLPDAPPLNPEGDGVGTRVPDAANPDEEGTGTRHPDDPAPAPPKLSPQDVADQAAAKAAQAQADADAAQQARRDAQNADESQGIKSRTTEDPDVAAAEAAKRAAHDAQDAASQKASEPEDPWDPTKNKDALDQAKQNSKDAEQAAADAANAHQQQQDANDAAARQAVNQANDAANAAKNQAAAAKEAASNAQQNADAAAAKAASDAARAANPAQAAADDAQKALAAAQKNENDAFFGKDAQAYHDARAALDAARAKAAAAQAAADAAKNNTGSPIDPPHKP